MTSVARAAAHHARGELARAETLYREALAGDGHDGAALLGLAALCCQTDRPRRAVALLQRLLDIQPADPRAHAWLSVALEALGELAAAASAAEQVARLLPDAADPLNRLGRLHQARGDLAGALNAYTRAVELDPRHGDALHNLAIALQSAGDPQRAVEVYRRAAELDPANPWIRYNTGVAQMSLADYAGALTSMSAALERSTEHLEALVARSYLECFVCRWEAIREHAAMLEARLQEHTEARGRARVSPYSLNIIPVSAACRRRVAAYYAQQCSAGLTPLPPAPPRADGPLRIGYLSPDFRHHAVGFVFHGVPAAHDRAAVTVHAYSLYTADDGVQRAVREGADVFRDLSALPPVAAARTIRDDGIDVLIDLAGYTWRGRPEILAQRPAPVQMSWLGYLDTMAAAFIDYTIADHVVAPAGEEAGFTEALIRLPGSFLPGTPLPVAPQAPTREDLGLPGGALVLASFNNPYKIDERTFACWMRVLHAVPESVLWLYVADVDEAAHNLRAAARGAGIEPDRLVFAPTVPIAAHLARLAHADLFLDTMHYNAGATAVAALQAGVPVLAREGDRWLARMGASLNRFLGLEELVCSSDADYLETAIRLARDRERLGTLRSRLTAAVAQRALLDPRRSARAIEEACAGAWARHRAGAAPAGFDVPSRELSRDPDSG